MSDSVLMGAVVTPPVLFFVLGVLAAACRSDLEVPAAITRFLGLYLLLAIGFHGGVSLARTGVTVEVAVTLAAAAAAAALVPLYVFALMRRRLDAANAAAVAAAYGSVSAVTFITAGALLRSMQIEYGGHMVAAMAIMESPAIVVSLALLRRADPGARQTADLSAGALVRDAFLNGSVFLILGSLVIGLVTGDQGWQEISPFADHIFKGMLCIFLLDMGMMAARQAGALRQAGWLLPVSAVGLPIANALAGLAAAWALGLAPGDAVLFIVLCASASYIAVPAAMRLAAPTANPSIYVGMALGITFPFNILVGLPVYLALVRWLWAGWA
jgi:hypothetical protein